ncbi:MAG: 23S rRNA (cytidine(2498)-2'-O)-methyltransferase RlmM [Magnetococcales bacterium]|nr:23S rRNA (cytidine(2498)-2'-O)-methyltransferase RlmM [Magnetococcales bacterium]
MNDRHAVMVFCRAGFESECLMELRRVITTLGLEAEGDAMPRSGHVLIRSGRAGDERILLEKISFRRLVFARHIVLVDDGETPLTPGDRIETLCARLDVLSRRTGPFSRLWLGWPDHEEGRVLAPLCRALQGRMEEGLRSRGLLDPNGQGVRAEVVFLEGTRALTGCSLPTNSSSWPMGIPRLRLPVASPSRSALKLEEALVGLVGAEMTPREGQKAIDLGAAPGGWTWAMARRGVSVTAVDRGALAAHVRNLPGVQHLREDGFRFKPPVAVDWLLCDIVDQPRRVADLVARWAGLGWCRWSIFNLKLPMKKRDEEVRLCQDRIEAHLRSEGLGFQLRFRQLYHDREEVTGFLGITTPSGGFPRRRRRDTA